MQELQDEYSKQKSLKTKRKHFSKKKAILFISKSTSTSKEYIIANLTNKMNKARKAATS